MATPRAAFAKKNTKRVNAARVAASCASPSAEHPAARANGAKVRRDGPAHVDAHAGNARTRTPPRRL